MTKGKKVVYQEHHPDYNKPKFTIKLRMYHHLMVTRVQRLRPTPENITSIWNLIRALNIELRFKQAELLRDVESSAERVKKPKK